MVEFCDDGGAEMAAGTSTAGRRWVTRFLLVALLGGALVAAVAAVTYATGVWGSLSSADRAQAKQAIVGYELAKASVRLPGMVGKRLTKRDKAVLQARFRREIARYATGPALAWGEDWDYPAALREDEWDTRELVGVSGRIAYWDVRPQGPGGDFRVRAGVEKRYKVIAWDAADRRAVPKRDWVTGVIVYDYTLRKVAGAWKVADSAWWRFYDPATGQLGTGP
jgi:hypothetical protein